MKTLSGGTVLLLAVFTVLSSLTDEKTIALVHGTLIDGTGGPPLTDAVVIIKAGRITAVGTGLTLKAPDGATILDVGGASILPGFINSHVHGAYNLSFRRMWARAGVATVRDLAAYPPSWYALREESNRDPVNSRLVASGPQMTVVKGFVPPGYPFSTIELIGMNEACENLFGADIALENGQLFSLRVLE